jgi:type I restriction enzyme S subunit
MANSLNNYLNISKASWSPHNSDTKLVNHYSIPNFDQGAPQEELAKDIKSNKFLISQPCILISKLNPEKPRIWLIENLLPGVSVCSTEFVVLIPKKIDDLRYLYFQLKSDKVGSRLRETATGTSNSHQRVRPDAILEIEVPWIEDDKQRTQAADFLWDLEMKAQLNDSMSKTLESLARAIFNSWFVDFEPVKAKEAGSKPSGLDAGTASLFPDSLEDSELGPIPKDWEVLPAGELFSIGIGRTPPRKESEWFSKGNSGVPWVSIRDMGMFGTFSQATSECLTEAAVVKFRVPVVPENTVLMSFKLTVGKLCITDVPVVTNEAIAHFRIPSDGRLDSYFAYLWLSQYDMRTLDSTSSIGTATNSGVIRNIKFLVPPQELLSHFHKTIAPVFKKLKILRQQSTTLMDLRDSLLPRLVSGTQKISKEMLAQ